MVSGVLDRSAFLIAYHLESDRQDAIDEACSSLVSSLRSLPFERESLLPTAVVTEDTLGARSLGVKFRGLRNAVDIEWTAEQDREAVQSFESLWATVAGVSEVAPAVVDEYYDLPLDLLEHAFAVGGGT